jgi:hypothetical protein
MIKLSGVGFSFAEYMDWLFKFEFDVADRQLNLVRICWYYMEHKAECDPK